MLLHLLIPLALSLYANLHVFEALVSLALFLLVFPPVGTGAVRVTRGDIKRLDDGEYLNDTIIEFGLK